ncbi:MerR family transcriptional regulator [Streptomyces sp. 35G-GA-8]|uniref:helix-turn-helix domain-containing protein n=1 Tax=Streptomyces sp. 35G-GA-8 TaxID=2939434 RepID=UPI00201F7311|nr:MerR family transcriptional regulator [Streptomyces sp. 35G-GA-8]MCL7380500.1 MerR family transcriptional regulator [Streptomyces sp. 35G-GA-8]
MKTIRYYSGIGLLPKSGRSRGGHRSYTADALSRLGLIQRLRALDTPIAAIARVMTGERSLADLVTRELDTFQAHMRELTWRQGILRALDDCPELERLRRLALLAEVGKLAPDQPAAPLAPGRHRRRGARTTSQPHHYDRPRRRRTPRPHQRRRPAPPTAEPPGRRRRVVLLRHHGRLHTGRRGPCLRLPARRTEALDHFVPTYARISGRDDTRRSVHTSAPGSATQRTTARSRCTTGDTPSLSPAKRRLTSPPPARDTSPLPSPPWRSPNTVKAYAHDLVELTSPPVQPFLPPTRRTFSVRALDE